jgi:hypothetical protein
MRFLFLIAFFIIQPLHAAVKSWEIIDPSQVQAENTQLVTNQALGFLHPTLKAVNYNGANEFPLQVGDGRHGAFVPANYSQFSVNGDLSGNRIRLDSDRFTPLQVTNFVLAQGWVLEVSGNKPLIIQSQTNIQIMGEIWCHGENGEDATLAAPGEGGIGRCGGTRGGDGGTNLDDAESGVNVGYFDSDDNFVVVLEGGKRGSSSTAAMDGGGGASWNDSSPATNADTAVAPYGLAGPTMTDPEFDNMYGSAGGGGGASGLGSQPGAGGGGAGGLVVLHAVQDIFIGEAPSSNYGLIRINGGDGGNSTATTGGAGGGGGAGSVQVLAGRNIEIYNNVGSGVVISQSGIGGSNGSDSGGNGGRARNWFSSVGYNLEGGGFYQPAEQTIAPGVVEYSTSRQAAESITFDLKNTLTDIQAVQVLPTSSEVSWQVSGSEDNFQNDDTGWTTDLSKLKRKRYLKARVFIESIDANNPATIESVNILYEPGNRTQFDFEAAGCGRVISSRPPKGPFFILLLLPFFVVFSLLRRSKKQQN